MEVQELRIGNYVKIFDTITQIEGMSTWDNFIQSSNFAEREISEFEPIQLTEEWLLNFGFIRHHEDYSNNIIYIKNVYNNTEFEWGVYPNEIGSGVQIINRKELKYVHQLQNLCYSLTGEELKLNQ